MGIVSEFSVWYPFHRRETEADTSSQYSLKLSWPLNRTRRLVVRLDKRTHVAFHLGVPERIH